MRKLLLLTLIPFLIGATYDVDTTGAGDYQTMTEVNAATFSPGDIIRFKRGQVWRDALLIPDSGDSIARITYTAYGNGEMPLIQTSVEENDTGDWSDEGGDIWSNNDAAFTVDVGNIIFNNGEDFGLKVFNEVDVDSDLEYWYDSTNDLIKIYSATNPASRFGDIECAIKYTGANTLSSVEYVTIEQLHYRYNGNQTLFGSTDNIIIQDCKFSYNGGAEASAGVRFGGGVGLWDSGSNWIIRRNIFDNEWDSGPTIQGTGATISIDNITIENNIIKNCMYGYEFFETGNGGAISNVYVYNNTIVNSGSGWSAEQRGASGGSGWGFNLSNSGTNTISNYNIMNNIISEAEGGTSPAVVRIGVVGFNNWSDMAINYNNYYQSSGDAFIWEDADTYTLAEFSDWQTDRSQDGNSVNGDPVFDGGNYALGSTSSGLNVGVSLSDVKYDYRRLPRGNPPDMGAMEFGGVLKVD